MLDGIDVHIIHMGAIVTIIAEGVFPIAPMPEALFAPPLFRSAQRRSSFGKPFATGSLTRRHRLAWSASPSGEVHMQCR